MRILNFGPEIPATTIRRPYPTVLPDYLTIFIIDRLDFKLRRTISTGWWPPPLRVCNEYCSRKWQQLRFYGKLIGYGDFARNPVTKPDITSLKLSDETSVCGFRLRNKRAWKNVEFQRNVTNNTLQANTLETNQIFHTVSSCFFALVDRVFSFVTRFRYIFISHYFLLFMSFAICSVLGLSLPVWSLPRRFSFGYRGFGKHLGSFRCFPALYTTTKVLVFSFVPYFKTFPCLLLLCVFVKSQAFACNAAFRKPLVSFSFVRRSFSSLVVVYFTRKRSGNIFKQPYAVRSAWSGASTQATSRKPVPDTQYSFRLGSIYQQRHDTDPTRRLNRTPKRCTWLGSSGKKSVAKEWFAKKFGGFVSLPCIWSWLGKFRVHVYEGLFVLSGRR